MTQRLEWVEDFGDIPFAVKDMNHLCRWTDWFLYPRQSFNPPIRFFPFKGASSLGLMGSGSTRFFLLWGFIRWRLGMVRTMPQLLPEQSPG